MPNFVEIHPSIEELLRLFYFSQWPLPPSWFFKFTKFYWLKGSRGPRHISCQISSKSANPLQRYCYFPISQDGGRRLLGFSNSQTLIGWRDSEGRYASLCQISSKLVNLLWRYCHFRIFNMAAIRHLGFVWVILDHPHRVLGGLYHSAKFGYDRCSSFDNMNVVIFGAFGWKRLLTLLQSDAA